MKTITSILVLIFVLVLTLILLPQPKANSESDVVAITDVRLFDGEQVFENATLLFAAGQIQAAGVDVPVPSGARVVDGSGKTVLPGLIDAHVHAYGSAQFDSLRFGVTVMLDMFRTPMDFAVTRSLRDDLSNSSQADLYSAGFLATAEGGHGTQYGIRVPLAETPQAADAWVEARMKEGSDYIKIVVEDGSSFGGNLPTLDQDMVTAMIRAAHARDMLAVVHVSTLSGARMAIEAGADGLVHLFADKAVDREFAELARDAGVWIVPTTTVLGSMHGYPGMDWVQQFPDLAAALTAPQRQILQASFPGGKLRQPRWPAVLASIATLHEHGVTVLAGSDAPNSGTGYGVSMHHEMALLNEAGLSPLEALRAATSLTAKAFKLEGRGCLQVGCRADLLLVEGNPLESITDSTRIVTVWKNGHQVERSVASEEAPEPASDPAATLDPVNLLSLSQRWMATGDSFMGGSSSAQIDEPTDSEPDASTLAVSGTLRSGFAFPYAGVMWNTNDVVMEATDHSGHRTLSIQVDGDHEYYRVMFFSGEQSAQPVWVDLPPGELSSIELDTLGGLERSQLRAIGVFASDGMGDFTFRISRARLE